MTQVTGLRPDPQYAAAIERATSLVLMPCPGLAPTMHALGDRTRLAIVLYLVENGPVSMQELSAAVQVHQSTVSRQVAALRKAALVDVDLQRRTCHTLLAAIE